MVARKSNSKGLYYIWIKYKPDPEKCKRWTFSVTKNAQQEKIQKLTKFESFLAQKMLNYGSSEVFKGTTLRKCPFRIQWIWAFANFLQILLG